MLNNKHMLIYLQKDIMIVFFLEIKKSTSVWLDLIPRSYRATGDSGTQSDRSLQCSFQPNNRYPDHIR